MKTYLNNTENFVYKTDSYKLGHWKQYPTGMKTVVSYLESRGGLYDKTLFAGLMPFLYELEGVKVKMSDIEEAKQFALDHFGNPDVFNKEGWEYIVKRHGGKLPIKIKAAKEGTLIPVSNVLMTMENTDPNCFWLTNVLETQLMRLWYTITVATNSFHAKQIIGNYLNKTANNLDSLPFKLHDFGYRGVSSEETAGLGAMAHLMLFMGTDTLAGILYANKYYGANEMVGFSVPASEHSVATSFGIENEDEYFLNMIRSYPTGIVSIVSDTYNVFNFINTMSENHKEEILERDGTVVFRPDSGDPVDINLQLIDILWKQFSEYGTITENGYRLLPPQVRLIQGDGIDNDMLERILDAVTIKGYSAENWVFGSGGGLLQKFDRDTQKFAIKACYGERDIDGKVIGFPISKDPITSKGKKSKGGRLKLVLSSTGEYFTATSEDPHFDKLKDELELVFENGKIKRFETFSEIRERANSFLIIEEKEMVTV